MRRLGAAGHATVLRVAVLGVGLIGGSIGLAARSRAGARGVRLRPRPAACCARALELGAIDAAGGRLAAAVAGADVVFVAAPVGALAADVVRGALDGAGPDCVVSDVGSTKRVARRGRRRRALRRRPPPRGRRDAPAWSTRARTCSRAPPGI